ncbi:MAG: NifB/NifX family molybdenum-iron cluster-binding protein [Candidatus Lernaella stagnicola]|nr:NifB/NifX family molybdenum-iron cluster-binding protein [Candidatus Lernaella stagnicola]
MKIAITCSGNNLDAPVDPRFGRASSFIIYEDETGEFELVSNEQNLQASQGAGVQAGQNIVATGAQALISGHVGPKAYHVLKTAGVSIYLSEAGTVREAIDALRAGRLQQAQGADRPGHWG